MAIADTLIATPPPLRLDPNGTLYVGETRVPLDTVIGVYGMGVSPEEIVRRYDVLCLSDVYAVIGYYLAHREEVDSYLAERRRLAEKLRAENQRRFPTQGVREKLLARRQGRDG
jgi:uncharacterized protein (DUF433 family)